MFDVGISWDLYIYASINHLQKSLFCKVALKCIDFERRHTNGQQAYKKVLNMTSHQGAANQNHNEMSPHTCQDGYYWKKKKQSKRYVLGGWEEETFVHCCWKRKLVQPLWKQFATVS